MRVFKGQGKGSAGQSGLEGRGWWLGMAGVSRVGGRTKQLRRSKKSGSTLATFCWMLDPRPRLGGVTCGQTGRDCERNSLSPTLRGQVHQHGQKWSPSQPVLGPCECFPACCAADPPQMRTKQSPSLCARGCRAMPAVCQGRVRAATCGARIPGRHALGRADCGVAHLERTI